MLQLLIVALLAAEAFQERTVLSSCHSGISAVATHHLSAACQRLTSAVACRVVAADEALFGLADVASNAELLALQGDRRSAPRAAIVLREDLPRVALRVSRKLLVATRNHLVLKVFFSFHFRYKLFYNWYFNL